MVNGVKADMWSSSYNMALHRKKQHPELSTANSRWYSEYLVAGPAIQSQELLWICAHEPCGFTSRLHGSWRITALLLDFSHELKCEKLLPQFTYMLKVFPVLSLIEETAESYFRAFHCTPALSTFTHGIRRICVLCLSINFPLEEVSWSFWWHIAPSGMMTLPTTACVVLICRVRLRVTSS